MHHRYATLVCAWLLWSQAYPLSCTENTCTINLLIHSTTRLVQTFDAIDKCEVAQTALQQQEDDKKKAIMAGDTTVPGTYSVARCLPSDIPQPTDAMMLPH